MLLFGASIYYSLIISNGKVDLNTFELIYDTDPRFVLSYQLYIQRVLNTLIGGSLMRFSAPSFCVIISGIITTRDWKDNLYEIERAGGVSPTKYFVGKFSSVLFFSTLLSLFASFVAFHTYILTRGGVPSISSPLFYVFDSTIRVLRVFFMAVFPGILIFVSAVFFASSITHSGFGGSIFGFVIVLFKFLAEFYISGKLPAFYHDYISPTPVKLYQYWTYYDTEWFFEKEIHNPFTIVQMITSLGCLYLIAAVFVAISYLCIKQRKT
ncbi:MAG: hypothetical protein IKI03_09035 [Clostridia bacterium]|nr:hypothetical protein [Clostridia bacterium]